MKAQAACTPCILSQILRVAEEQGGDEWVHRKVLNEVMGLLPGTDYARSPAEVLSDALAVARRALSSQDPLAAARTKLVQELAPLAQDLRARVAGAPDRLAAATVAAAAANVVDALALGPLDVAPRVLAAFEKGLVQGHPDELRAALFQKQKVLYVLDNAGESLVDALLIEELKNDGKEVTVALRRPGLLHDAARADAQASGLEALPAVENAQEPLLGNAPVVCGADFRRALEAAEVVIGKGAAAWETLAEERKNAVFLLAVKCEPVARAIGARPGDLVLLRP